MLGPALGGALYGLGGWALPLGTAAALCAGFSLALALLLPKAPPGGARAHAHAPAEGSAGHSSGLCAVTSPRLLAVLIIVASGACIFASVDSVLPVHLQEAYGSGSVGSALVFFVISVRPPPRPSRSRGTTHEAKASACARACARVCACARAALAGGRGRDGRGIASAVAHSPAQLCSFAHLARARRAPANGRRPRPPPSLGDS